MYSIELLDKHGNILKDTAVYFNNLSDLFKYAAFNCMRDDASYYYVTDNFTNDIWRYNNEITEMINK